MSIVRFSFRQPCQRRKSASIICFDQPGQNNVLKIQKYLELYKKCIYSWWTPGAGSGTGQCTLFTVFSKTIMDIVLDSDMI